MNNLVAIIQSKNNWDDPVSFIDHTNEIRKILPHIISDCWSYGLIPIFLKNLSILKEIQAKSWVEIISRSGTLDNKQVMGLINLVDFFFKYIQVDIRPFIKEIESLEIEKRNFVIEYFFDCPMCLLISDNERKSNFEKHSVKTEDIEHLKVTLTQKTTE